MLPWWPSMNGMVSAHSVWQKSQRTSDICTLLGSVPGFRMCNSTEYRVPSAETRGSARARCSFSRDELVAGDELVDLAARQQLVVRALIDDAAGVHDDDAVGVLHGA